MQEGWDCSLYILRGHMSDFLKTFTLRNGADPGEKLPHKVIYSTVLISSRERSGSVVECLTRDRGPWVRASPVSLRCGL